MPYDHQGHLVEAVDCASCNSSLEWHGRLPEDPNDVVCNDCNADRLLARASRAESQRDAALAKLLDAEAEVVRLREAAQEVIDADVCSMVVVSGPNGRAIIERLREALRPTAAQPKEPT